MKWPAPRPTLESQWDSSTHSHTPQSEASYRITPLQTGLPLAVMLLLTLLALLPSGVAPSTAQHAAAAQGNSSEIKSLHAAGHSLDAVDETGMTPIITLLSSWHNQLNANWPGLSAFAPLNATFHTLLDAGASPALQCPLMDAVIFRNMHALSTLVSLMNSSELSHCLTSVDANGAMLGHHLAGTPSAGLARLFFRARRLPSRGGKGDSLDTTPPGIALSRYLQLEFPPVWEAVEGYSGAPSSSTGKGKKQQPLLKKAGSPPPIMQLTKIAIEEAVGMPDVEFFSLALESAKQAPLKGEEVGVEQTLLSPNASTTTGSGSSGSSNGVREEYESTLIRESLGHRNGHGWTPLDTACGEGRWKVLRWLLAELPPTSPTAPNRDDGLSCVHLAAARNDVLSIQVLGEMAGALGGSGGGGGGSGSSSSTLRAPAITTPLALSLLFARDALNRTGCDVASEGGVVTLGAYKALKKLGVPCTHPPLSPSSGGCPASPIARALELEQGDPFTLPPAFSLEGHQSLGWSVASSKQLQGLGLPADFFTAAAAAAAAAVPEDASASASRSAPKRRGGGLLGGYMRCSIDILPPPPPTPHTTTPSAPAGGDSSSAAGTRAFHQGLTRHYLSQGRPFLMRSGAGAGGCMSRQRVIDTWGDSLTLQVGPIPYALSYGVRGGTAPLGDFVRQAMGEGGEELGFNSSFPPPYIFDSGALMGGRFSGSGSGSGSGNGEYLEGVFSGIGNFSALYYHALIGAGAPRGSVPPGATQPAQQQQQPGDDTSGTGFTSIPGLAQLIIGPPLSGASPHFHRAAVNALGCGLKLWYLTPPSHAAFVEGAAAAWWEGQLSGAGARASQTPRYLFLQGPGDVVYIPPLWGHAVINLADSFAVALE